MAQTDVTIFAGDFGKAWPLLQACFTRKSGEALNKIAASTGVGRWATALLLAQLDLHSSLRRPALDSLLSFAATTKSLVGLETFALSLAYEFRDNADAGVQSWSQNSHGTNYYFYDFERRLIIQPGTEDVEFLGRNGLIGDLKNLSSHLQTNARFTIETPFGSWSESSLSEPQSQPKTVPSPGNAEDALPHRPDNPAVITPTGTHPPVTHPLGPSSGPSTRPGRGDVRPEVRGSIRAALKSTTLRPHVRSPKDEDAELQAREDAERLEEQRKAADSNALKTLLVQSAGIIAILATAALSLAAVGFALSPLSVIILVAVDIGALLFIGYVEIDAAMAQMDAVQAKIDATKLDVSRFPLSRDQQTGGLRVQNGTQTVVVPPSTAPSANHTDTSKPDGGGGGGGGEPEDTKDQTPGQGQVPAPVLVIPNPPPREPDIVVPPPIVDPPTTDPGSTTVDPPIDNPSDPTDPPVESDPSDGPGEGGGDQDRPHIDMEITAPRKLEAPDETENLDD